MENIIFKDRATASDAHAAVKGLRARLHQSVAKGRLAPQGILFERAEGSQAGSTFLKPLAANTVVVGGAIASLEALTGATANWKPSTLNETMGIPATAGIGQKSKISLFGAGTGGCNLDFGSTVDISIKQQNILDPVPMRNTIELTGDDAARYFLRQENDGAASSSWWLKSFSDDPTIKTHWKNNTSEDEDGTEITSDIFNSTSTDGIEVFTEYNIVLNTTDIREDFEANGALSSARYNTFGFYTGTLNEDGSEYADVRLYSAISFNNRDLSLPCQSSFVYRVYSLI